METTQNPFNEYLTKAEFCNSVPGGPISERTADRWHLSRIGPPRVVVGRTVLYHVGREALARRAHARPHRGPGVSLKADIAVLVDHVELVRDRIRADVEAVADLVRWRPQDFPVLPDDELLRDRADAKRRLEVVTWIDELVDRLNNEY